MLVNRYSKSMYNKLQTYSSLLNGHLHRSGVQVFNSTVSNTHMLHKCIPIDIFVTATMDIIVTQGEIQWVTIRAINVVEFYVGFCITDFVLCQ